MREHVPLPIAIGGPTVLNAVMPTMGLNRCGRLWTV